MRRKIEAAGYVEVKTPQILDRSLWERSGHWEKFHADMFVCETDEGETLAVKPMNCPGHIQIFNHGQRSYRELPIRMAEFEGLHRYEGSGGLHGLLRVRQLAQDDGHIFCREDQVEAETRRFVALLNTVYADLGVELHSVKLALRPELRAGSDEMWDRAEAMLDRAARDAGLTFEVLPGEGGFYAPKLEFHLRDAIGRTWQCGTLQLDYGDARASGCDLHRRGRAQAPAGDAAPRDLRLDRAVPRRADRALRGRIPALARAGAGGGGDHHLRRRRLCGEGPAAR